MLKSSSKIALCAICSFAIALPAFADCDGVLTAARELNYARTTASQEDYVYQNACRYDATSDSQNFNASLDASYAAIISLDAKFASSNKHDAVVNWCQTHNQTGHSAIDTENYSSRVVTASVQAWLQCKAIDNENFKVAANVSSDARLFNMSITPAPGQPLEFSGIDVQGFKCTHNGDGSSKTNLSDRTGFFTTHTTWTMNCSRIVANNKASAAAISVTTNKPFVMFFPAQNQLDKIAEDELTEKIVALQNQLNVKTAPTNLSGVGEIVATLLGPAQFAAQRGTDWHLADGSSAKGTKYEQLTGKTTLPDLRGMFIRGKQNGRKDGGNPAGDLELGAFQGDSIGSHKHSVTAVVDDHTQVGGHYQGGSITNNTVGEKALDSGDVEYAVGDNDHRETRPRNVTVNYFIKVN